MSAIMILVVDSDPSDRSKLCTALLAKGYDVLEAEDGNQAIERMRRQAFDAVLLELNLPGMDGFDVLSAMRADSALESIPVIVISTRDDMGSVLQSINKGAAYHFSKPFDPISLHILLQTVLPFEPKPEKQEESSRHVFNNADAFADISEPVEDESEEQRGMGIGRFVRYLFFWARPYRQQLSLYLFIMIVALGQKRPCRWD